MLTESREAMSLVWSPQNLAIASLSSPHFDANPFLPADNIPRHPEEPRACAASRRMAASATVAILRGSPLRGEHLRMTGEICRGDGAHGALMGIYREFESS
jgi:hypothetical protein